MKVAIFGCGPAGLFAAHAAEMAGHKATVFSKARKSHMYGAQFLHKYIPGLSMSADRFIIDYELVGTAEDYAQKVYGDSQPSFVSPQTLAGAHEAWDIRAAYDQAWEAYSWAVRDAELKASDVEGVLQHFDLIVNTVPAPVFCVKPEKHSFTSRDVWAIGDAPDRGVQSPLSAGRDNHVLCNGYSEPSWYRVSTIKGHSTVEWPLEPKPPYENVAKVTKPISNTCDCWDDTGKYWRAGRYGLWRKDVLSHHAYWWTYEAFKAVAL